MKRLLGLVLILIVSANNICVKAAGKNDKNKDTGINTETLTGGVIHREGYYLPRGMKVPVILRTPIDTRFSKEKDLVTVQTAEDIVIGDYVMIPANSFLHGYISYLEGPGKMHKRPKVAMTFDSVSIKGKAGGDSRKYLTIRGSIKETQVLAKAERVNDGQLYKPRAKKAAIVGGATGLAAGYGYSTLAMPFGGLGISSMMHTALMLGTGVAGAYIAAGLIEKDDVRLESGTEMEVVLEEPTLEPFSEESQLAMDKIEDLAPAEAYDKYDELNPQLLEKAKAPSPRKDVAAKVSSAGKLAAKK